jgi:hypothetical protein
MRKWLLTVFALAVFTPTAEAQQKVPDVVFGVSFGRIGVSPFAFTDIPYTLAHTDPTEFRPCTAPGSELQMGAHLGAAITRAIHFTLHAEANTGSTRACGDPRSVDDSPAHVKERLATANFRATQTYTSVEYQGRTVGYDYLALFGRVVVEPPVSRGIVRPRFLSGVGRIGSKNVWIWQAGVGASVGTGRTHLTFDAGDDLYRSHYTRVLRTYDAIGGTVIREETQKGSEYNHGLAVRVGIDHYFR